jgi:alkanesulfonate monooxygenase SsuD/methylene tetrahydromethanopterin reductase-like flavin-dependent oxidoreductase (luciferase family)
MPAVRLGALCWNQYSDWDSLLEAGQRAERLGYDDLWTWDHLYPIVGNHEGPMFEAWLTITAWAMATERIRIGLMVGANTFRNPALTAKMATTFDHISGGRAILGIGAAWFETEHTGFGLRFGDGPPERLRWLGEALPIMRGMLDGTEPTATGPRYSSKQTRNLPPPLQSHMPICVGGGGEQVTLKLVARYADMNNVGGGIESIRRKEETLLRHCETVGRDPSTIERTAALGPVFIRDDKAEAERGLTALFEHNGGADVWPDLHVGPVDHVIERLTPYVELGYRHFTVGLPSPYDEETMTRMATEVRPALERI